MGSVGSWATSICWVSTSRPRECRPEGVLPWSRWGRPAGGGWLVVMAALWFLAASPPAWGGAATPRLTDIIQQHEVLKSQIRSGRITYVLEAWSHADMLEAMKAGEKAHTQEIIERLRSRDLSAKDLEMNLGIWEPRLAEADVRATAQFLARNGRHEFTFVFDREQAAYLRVAQDLRDRAALIEQYGLGKVGERELPEKEVKAVVGTKGLTYDSGNNVAMLTLASRFNEAPGRAYDDILDHGFLTADMLDPRARVTIESADAGRVLVVLAGDDARAEMLLDPGLGFRVVQFRGYREGRLMKEISYSYAMWGDDVFPATIRVVALDAEGRERKTRSYEFTKVELNVPVRPEEFQFDIPADAAVFDGQTGETIRERISFDFQALGRMELDAIADSLLDEGFDALLEADDAGSPLAAVPEEAHEQRAEPTERSAGAGDSPVGAMTTASAGRRRIPVWAFCLAGAAAAACLLVAWRRRKREA